MGNALRCAVIFLLFTALCCSKVSTPTGPEPQQMVGVVEVRDNSFEPKSVTIKAGDAVRWVRAGQSNDHTVTAVDGSFDSGNVLALSGNTFQHTFTQDGKTFEYFCRTHRECCGMQGSVRVGTTAPAPSAGF